MSASKSGRLRGKLRAKFKRRRMRATGEMRHIVRRKQKARLKHRR